jgi:hypothetical protein
MILSNYIKKLYGLADLAGPAAASLVCASLDLWDALRVSPPHLDLSPSFTSVSGCLGLPLLAATTG